jgi:hypothetical protein
LLREAKAGVGGQGAADGGVGVVGEGEKLAGGELRMQGSLGADGGVGVRGELDQEMRRGARISGEKGEDGG